MTQDFIKELGYLGFTMRIKRLSDALIHSGRKLYQDLNLEIEPNWFSVFKILEKHEAMSVTEIADRIGLSHPSVISIINNMTKKEFLTAQKDAKDSRKKVLMLTEKAKQELPTYNAIWASGDLAMQKALEPHDALVFVEKLEAIFGEQDFCQRLLHEKSQQVSIVESKDKYHKDFERLNYEWLEKYFSVEPYDAEILGNPKKHIIDKGGFLFYALLGEEVVGTVALITRGEGIFELSKMAVTEKYRGFKIGYKLMLHCIEFARQYGTEVLFLDSNTKLKPAINLYRKVGFQEIAVPCDTPYERCNIRMEIRFK